MTAPHEPHMERLASLVATATEHGGATAIVDDMTTLSEEDAKATLIVAVGLLAVAARGRRR
jgi:hypothetical protein